MKTVQCCTILHSYLSLIERGKALNKRGEVQKKITPHGDAAVCTDVTLEQQQRAKFEHILCSISN
jgi:hypothetical protein